MSGALQGRSRFWDAARGVAILAVIWIHMPTGASFQGGEHAWNFDYWIASRQFLNFPVALFLFLAGYFVKPQRVTPPGLWLRGRIKRLLIPYLIWTSVYGLAEVAQDPGSLQRPFELLGQIIIGSVAAHLYFVVVLIQLTVLTPLLVKAAAQRWGSVLFSVTPVYVAFMYWFAFATGDLPELYNYFFPAWFAFYYGGIWVRVRGVKAFSTRISIMAVAIAAVVSVVEAYWLLSVSMTTGFAASQLKVSSILYAFAVIALVLSWHKLKPDAGVPGLVYLGERSYGIYFVHMIWIMGFGFMVERLHLFEALPVLPAIQVVGIALVLGLSVASISITRKLISKKYAAHLLGF
ncbi:surface polysaccharide O-acyltransferase-like enzyme [Pseudoclavibacter sp. JAI123]|uniref:acyltransferase n=1 Tax=Pseudoclavibacter sp. JAI123 TaxID=2723065 RepID=UPI0015CC5569|nr:acyltransferase [Pseudoclavibacter sp. JAI123]NYF12675.1 surface polysaccharide O-acyltransferase-like enzyme [Pseudoclavibacter sp. JAI123]